MLTTTSLAMLKAVVLLQLAVLGPLISRAENTSHKWACDSHIFCQGDLLHAVQRSGIFPDSKTFVDMTLKDDPSVILQKFEELKAGGITKDKLQTFLGEYFREGGHELEEWEPLDWTHSPSILNRIADPAFKNWAEELNKLWKVLARRMKNEVHTHPDRYSLIYVPNPFIVPGDRFREFYYWDSYWILNGLLLSDMHQTSKGKLENFIHVVQTIGFVPNGGRIYYSKRSQPPLLIPMVDSYYEATKDAEFIHNNIDVLEKEYNFWMANRTVPVQVPGSGDIHRLARYDVDLGKPRPEGYTEDLEMAHKLGLNDSAAADMYANIASACESGWDFSTRWFDWTGPYSMKMESIRTRNIIPVDLNAILLWNEKLLSKFYKIIGNEDKELFYERSATTRALAMNKVMWNEEKGVWFDYDTERQEQRQKFFVSNVFPLLSMQMAGISDMDSKTIRVLQYLKKEKVLTYPGGVPASLTSSGQQWDFPNAWSPMIVHFLVEALANSNVPEAQQMAAQIATTWLTSNLKAWQTHGAMYEKYDVRQEGCPGAGGEYSVQLGFGWSNGVILQLLDRYGQTVSSVVVAEKSFMEISSNIYVVVGVCTILAVALVVVGVMWNSRQKKTFSTETDSGLMTRKMN